jgi:hypothetical protein
MNIKHKSSTSFFIVPPSLFILFQKKPVATIIAATGYEIISPPPQKTRLLRSQSSLRSPAFVGLSRRFRHFLGLKVLGRLTARGLFLTNRSAATEFRVFQAGVAFAKKTPSIPAGPFKNSP